MMERLNASEIRDMVFMFRRQPTPPPSQGRQGVTFVCSRFCEIERKRWEKTLKTFHANLARLFILMSYIDVYRIYVSFFLHKFRNFPFSARGLDKKKGEKSVLGEMFRR